MKQSYCEFKSQLSLVWPSCFNEGNSGHEPLRCHVVRQRSSILRTLCFLFFHRIIWNHANSPSTEKIGLYRPTRMSWHNLTVLIYWMFFFLNNTPWLSSTPVVRTGSPRKHCQGILFRNASIFFTSPGLFTIKPFRESSFLGLRALLVGIWWRLLKKNVVVLMAINRS